MLLINLLNTLNPKFCSLAVAFSIHMQLTCHISICVQALTPKLNLCPLPALISRLVTLTIPTHQWGCNSQHYQLSHSCSEPKQPSLPETNPLKRMSDVSKPVLAVRVRIGPPGPNLPLSQPSLAATMCTATCRWPHPPSPVPCKTWVPVHTDYLFCTVCSVM